MIKTNQFLLTAKGEALFRPVYVDDLVHGIALAASVPNIGGQIFNLSSDGYVTTKQFFTYTING